MIIFDAAGDLSTETTSQRFSGDEHGAGVGVSFFLNHTPPGRGVDAHRHAYGEVFIVLDGEATVVVDEEQAIAHGGQIVVVPPGAVHAFRNAGSTTLEMISIHAAATMSTEWVDG